MKGRGFAAGFCAPLTALGFAAAHVFAVASAGAQIVPHVIIVPGPGISFAPLTGPDGATYLGHTEGDFAVTPTAGAWFQGLSYGNPIPSIYDGPINSPGTAVLQVTDSVGLFTLNSLHYSSNNGNSFYDIQGYLGATLAYHETGTLSGSFDPFSFNTLTTAHPNDPIDGLFIALIPGFGVSSINLDNIGVTTVPEPGSLLLLAAGLAALVRCRPSKRA